MENDESSESKIIIFGFWLVMEMPHRSCAFESGKMLLSTFYNGCGKMHRKSVMNKRVWEKVFLS